ncbi:integrin beta pat-3 [Octopus vulgaris]|uniref:Integrin beta pat-3 n=1 Tax=Octopus vulgaris TaxID=6645 RepID=A0AA36AIT7_OCTVU|nr:integrin beta pat-3 [Octopus vulgaris]
MSNQMNFCLLLICLFAYNVAGNDCIHEKTCGSCIQRNGTCSWCLSPDFHGASRCETRGTLLREGCSESSIYQSVNAAHLKKNRRATKKRLLKPQRVVLQLVPNTGYVLPVKGFLIQKDAHNRLGGGITLLVNAPKPLKVVMKSDCNQKYKTQIETSSCYGIHNGQAVTFSFVVSTEKCFPKKKVIKVNVKGIRKPQMIIYVKTKCNCDCELKKPTVNSDFHCNGNGKMVCGQCECSKQTQGKNCECHKSQNIDERNCIKPGDQLVCSGQGKCHCGSCECSPDVMKTNRYSGRFCECDKLGCRKYNNSLCGGPTHGKCVCGKCACKNRYTGEACEIDVRTKNCLSSSGQLCSDRGKCIRNQCQCETPFSGKVCERREEFVVDLTVHCIKSGTTDICSNQGKCVQGYCHCNKIPRTNQLYRGLYCECDDTSCPTSNGKICGGVSHGSCVCGKCSCQQQYSGDACEADQSNTKCLSPNGQLCNGQGNCIQNRCQCKSPYYGRLCDKKQVVRNYLNTHCIESKSSVICSNRGRCSRGFCRCNKIPRTNQVYTGKYCECDDTDCPTSNGKICGGRNHGNCKCGKCQCQQSYSGKACEVDQANQNCLSSNGELCSGHGNCIGNRCQCESPYFGKFCQMTQESRSSRNSVCKQSPTSPVCSNRGNCVQGFCKCSTKPGTNQAYSGMYCECDDFSCPTTNGKICGGRRQGICQCGKCKCHDNYKGKACEIDQPSLNCISRKGVCSGRGYCQNNHCICQDNHFGKTCEFSLQSEKNLTARCIEGNTSSVCSGRGDCILGLCRCHKFGFKTYTGQFCECNDYSCEYFDGKLCGGKKRGECVCGKCQCKKGFEGSSCSITKATDRCMASNGLLCNGKGICTNNVCTCVGTYKGPTCEDCPTCVNKCERMKQCVLCKVFGTGTLTFEQCIKCAPIHLVDSLDDIYTKKTRHLCLFIDDYDDCKVRFALEQRPNNKMKTYVIRRKECEA